MQEMSQLKSTGNVIDLSVTTAQLHTDLATQVRLENRVQTREGDHGCDLKWQSQHVLAGLGGALTCFNCPHADTEKMICKIGRKQCVLVERIAGLKIADSLDVVIGTAVARDFAAGAELADFALA